MFCCVVSVLQAVSFYLNVSDTQRALKLLEEYRSKLNQTENAQLQHAIDRVIDVFQSSLFHALIGKHLCGAIMSNPVLCCDCFLVFFFLRREKWGNRFDLTTAYFTHSAAGFSNVNYFPPTCSRYSRSALEVALWFALNAVEQTNDQNPNKIIRALLEFWRHVTLFFCEVLNIAILSLVSDFSITKVFSESSS